MGHLHSGAGALPAGQHSLSGGAFVGALHLQSWLEGLKREVRWGRT